MNIPKRVCLISSLATVLFTAGMVYVLSGAHLAPSVEQVTGGSFLVWLPENETRDPEQIFRDRRFTTLMARPGDHGRRTLRFWDDDSQPPELRGTRWVMENSEVRYFTKAGGADTAYPVSWCDEVAPSGAKVDAAGISGRAYRIRRVTPEESTEAGEVWRVDYRDVSGVTVFIGHALFSK